MTLPSPAAPRILIVSADGKATAELRKVFHGWHCSVQVAEDGVEGARVLTGPTPQRLH